MLCSVQMHHSVVSDSLQPHGLQHTRLPCPSLTPGACSNSCPLSQWCHPIISSSVILPFSSSLQSFPAPGSFPKTQFFPVNVCVVYSLYYVEVVFLYAHFLESFHHTWVLNFVKSSSASVEMILWLLSFNLVIWPITLIDLHKLKNSCIPGLSPSWSWCMILLMCLWIQFVSIILKILTSVFISDVDFSFFLCDIFVWFWYQGDRSPIEWTWEWRIYKCCSEIKNTNIG